MINRDLLPEDFVIERDASNELWPTYIEWLNKAFLGTIPLVKFDGNHSGYYGMIEDCPIIMPEPDTADVLSLEEWHSITHQSGSIEMVTTYEGEEHPIHRCHIIMDDAPHAGEYALRSVLHQVSIPSEGYALKSDCRQLVDGRYMLRSHECGTIVYSEYHDKYIDTEHDSSRYTEDGDWIDTQCSSNYVYISSSGLYFSTVEQAKNHGYIYSDRHDEWIHEDDWTPTVSECNATYHNLERQMKFGSDAKFTVGFEIEKEDDDAGTIHYEQLYDDTGWCKENDSSLDDDNGYELVSPAFDLYTSDLDNSIQNSDKLQRLINAEFSSNCGGHINVGSTIYNPEQLFEGLSGFFPLLYALYNGRIERDYCKAKKKHKYYDKDKYSSVYIRSAVVEFRIFSAVPSVKSLIWRRDLIRIMCDNFNKSEIDVLRMLVDSRSKLYKHLRLVYTQDKLIDKVELFIRYCDEFNNKKLPKLDVSKIKQDNLEIVSDAQAI